MLYEVITCPASLLTLGMKGGGSDAFSGLTANPLVGQMSDRVTAHGGRAILTEVPVITSYSIHYTKLYERPVAIGSMAKRLTALLGKQVDVSIVDSYNFV